MPKTREESFKILQLPESASEEEVKKAYKQKARELHPDKNPEDPHATKKFQELGEAYQRITSGKDDDEEFPDDFFMDPFELFLKVMLIKRMQQEQARRRFVHTFGGLVFEDDDDDDDFEFGFPFGPFGPFGGYTFETRTSNRGQRPSSSRSAKARTNNQRTQFNDRGNKSRSGQHSRHTHSQSPAGGSSRQNENATRRNFSHPSNSTEESCNSDKTRSEFQWSRGVNEGKENLDENSASGGSAAHNDNRNDESDVNIRPKGGKPKKKTQQTSDSWKKAKKGNKGSKKKPFQTGGTNHTTQSKGRFTGVNNTSGGEETVDEKSHQCQGGSSSDNMPASGSADTAKDEPARREEANAKAGSEGVGKGNSADRDETSEGLKQFDTKGDAAVYVASSIGKNPSVQQESEPHPRYKEGNRTVKEDGNSNHEEPEVSASAESTGSQQQESVIVNEEPKGSKHDSTEKENTCAKPQSSCCRTGNGSGNSVPTDARPKAQKEQSNRVNGTGKFSHTGRNGQPRKGGKRKNYVSKFQNIDKNFEDFKVPDAESKPSAANPGEGEESCKLISGKGFKWNKKGETPVSKDKASTKPNEKKDQCASHTSENKDKLDRPEVACIGNSSAAPTLSDSSKCKHQQYQQRSVDELYGNMKSKKSKAESQQERKRQQEQNGDQYYFGKNHATHVDREQRSYFSEHRTMPQNSRQNPLHQEYESNSYIKTKYYNSYTNQDQFSTSNAQGINNNYDQIYSLPNKNIRAAKLHAEHGVNSRYESQFQASHHPYSGSSAASTFADQNIRVGNHQGTCSSQSKNNSSIRSGPEHRTNHKASTPWLERELQRQQLYSMTPKSEQEERRQLEIALEMSSKQAA